MAVRDRTIVRVGIFAVTVVSAYFGIVYVFAFTQAVGSSRLGVHLAIGLMDALVAALVLLDVVGFKAGRSKTGPIRRTSSILRLTAYLSLVVIVLLHAEYARARFRGAEEGITGSLLTLKSYLLLAQLCYVFCAALSGAIANRRNRLSWRLPNPSELLVLSLPGVPLINYLAYNTDIFSLLTAIEFLAFFLVLPGLSFFVVQLLQEALEVPPVSAPVVAGLGLVYYSMPAVASWLMRPVESLFAVHLLLAVSAGAGLAALYRVNPKRAAGTLAFLAVVSAAGSAVAAALADRDKGDRVKAAASRSGTSEDLQRRQLEGLWRSPAPRRPDVFLLVYDGYAPTEMMKRYGIDAHADTEYLHGQGFTVYEDAYSLFMSSRVSMSSLMDMRSAPRAGIGGDTTAMAFFRQQGYKTHLVLNSYLLQGSVPIRADVVFPPWNDRSALSTLYRGIGGGEFKAEIVFQDSDRNEWLAAKRAVLAAGGDAPKMLYAHSGYPGHSQNSGECLPDETARYAERVQIARDEMRRDIDAILGSKRDAIIIVAGDHGPHLTGDCLYMARYRPSELTADHLADRYAAKLAIRWPGEAPAASAGIRVVQDVFFAVAAALLNDDRVWQHRPSTRTIGYGGIPDGAVEDGLVTIGRDKGRPLLPHE